MIERRRREPIAAPRVTSDVQTRTKVAALGALLVVAGVLAACRSVGAEEVSPSPELLVRPSPPASCPVTVPGSPLIPPQPYPQEAPFDSAWYGTADVWTMLDRSGEVWWALPHDEGGYGQKTFWWSRHYVLKDEPQPAIAVVGRRLDAPSETFEVPGPGTNASQADIGTAMLVGVEIPSAGCWELAATYREASLAYVVWVAGD